MITHKSTSLADQVFEKLERDILCGKYEIGETLTEMRLSEELGVSRTPVREALRRLAHEHIVKESGKGSIVVGITKEDIKDIFDIRIRIEDLAVRKAVEKMTPERLKQLKDTLDMQEFYVIKDNHEYLRNMDSQFHDLIYSFSESNTFDEVLKLLHKKTMKFRRVSLGTPDRAAKSLGEHKAILSAIEAGDAELAAELCIKHIENARDNIMKIEVNA